MLHSVGRPFGALQQNIGRNCPGGERIEHLASDVGILASGAGRHVEGMIGVLEEPQRRALAEPFRQRRQQREVRQRVAGSLQEQHRDLHVEQMLGALVRRLARRMQREAEEDEAADSRQRRRGLRLRRHAAAERLAAGDQRKRGRKLRGCGDGRAHGRVRELRRVGPLAPLLHVGKLVAQRRDAALAELGRDALHERVRHAGPGAVRQHIAGARPRAAPGAGRRRGARHRP